MYGHSLFVKFIHLRQRVISISKDHVSNSPLLEQVIGKDREASVNANTEIALN